MTKTKGETNNFAKRTYTKHDEGHRLRTVRSEKMNVLNQNIRKQKHFDNFTKAKIRISALSGLECFSQSLFTINKSKPFRYDKKISKQFTIHVDVALPVEPLKRVLVDAIEKYIEEFKRKNKNK